jgi:hypothetical protein
MLIEPLTKPTTAGATPETTTTAHVLAAHPILCREEMTGYVRDPGAARQVVRLPVVSPGEPR